MKTHDFSFGLTELKSSYYFLDLLLDKQNRSILTPFLFPETIFFFEGPFFFFHYPIPPNRNHKSMDISDKNPSSKNPPKKARKRDNAFPNEAVSRYI